MKSSTTGWGYYEQGSDQLQEVMELGKKLSLAINCPIHYPAWGKKLFECSCGKLFPVFVVKGNSTDKLKEIHNGLVVSSMS